MALQVVFHRLAAKDIQAATAWYANRSADAAQRFRVAVSDAAQRIADDVGTHPVGATTFRYARLVKFPYHLIYRVELDTTARVVALSHFRRRPGHWRRRI